MRIDVPRCSVPTSLYQLSTIKCLFLCRNRTSSYLSLTPAELMHQIVMHLLQNAPMRFLINMAAAKKDSTQLRKLLSQVDTSSISTTSSGYAIGKNFTYLSKHKERVFIDTIYNTSANVATTGGFFGNTTNAAKLFNTNYVSIMQMIANRQIHDIRSNNHDSFKKKAKTNSNVFAPTNNNFTFGANSQFPSNNKLDSMHCYSHISFVDVKFVDGSLLETDRHLTTIFESLFTAASFNKFIYNVRLGALVVVCYNTDDCKLDKAKRKQSFMMFKANNPIFSNCFYLEMDEESIDSVEVTLQEIYNIAYENYLYFSLCSLIITSVKENKFSKIRAIEDFFKHNAANSGNRFLLPTAICVYRNYAYFISLAIEFSNISMCASLFRIALSCIDWRKDIDIRFLSHFDDNNKRKMITIDSDNSDSTNNDNEQRTKRRKLNEPSAVITNPFSTSASNSSFGTNVNNPFASTATNSNPFATSPSSNPFANTSSSAESSIFGQSNSGSRRRRGWRKSSSTANTPATTTTTATATTTTNNAGFINPAPKTSPFSFAPSNKPTASFSFNSSNTQQPPFSFGSSSPFRLHSDQQTNLHTFAPSFLNLAIELKKQDFVEFFIKLFSSRLILGLPSHKWIHTLPLSRNTCKSDQLLFASPFIAAIHYNNMEALCALLNRRIPPNRIFHAATYYGNLQAVKLLLAKLNMNIVKEIIYTACRSQTPNAELVKLLISKSDCKPNTNMLCFACSYETEENFALIDYFLDTHKIDINGAGTHDLNIFVPVSVLPERPGSVEAASPKAKKWFQSPANANFQSQTCLHYTIGNSSQSNSKMVDFLLSRNADPNATADNGITPLMMAVITKKEDIAVQLISKGADISIKDKLKGETALDKAKQASQQYLVAEMLNATHRRTQQVEDAKFQTTILRKLTDFAEDFKTFKEDVNTKLNALTEKIDNLQKQKEIINE